MIRKTALIGCGVGHWVRTSGMAPLYLNARVHEDAVVKVESTDGDEIKIEAKLFGGPGLHPLTTASWTRVSIPNGPTEGSVCIFETR